MARPQNGHHGDLAAENDALRRRVRELEAQRDASGGVGFRAMFDAAHDGILVARVSDQAIVLGNARAARMLGCDVADISTLRIHDLHPPEELPHVLDLFARQARREVEVAANLTVRRRDGSQFLADITSAPVLLDGEPCVVGYFRDVTDRNQALAALRQSEERWASVLDHSPFGIHMYDLTADDRLLFVGANQAADRILGVDNRRFIGQTIEEAFPALVSTEIPDRYREVARTGQGRTTQHVQYEDGQIRGAFDVHAFLTGPRRMVAAFIEVSELRRAMEAIRTLNDELERRVEDRTAALRVANRELEAFAYSVSHDLRAPLRGIDGFSGALLEDCAAKLDGKGLHYLDRIRENTRHMARLIDGLLTLSRVSRHEMATAPVDLGELARDLLRGMQEQEPRREVRVVVGGGLAVEGDPRLLRSMMANLLSNAWKFSRHAEEATIEVGAEDHDDRRAFFVRDNGAGFDASYSGKLFGPFQRLHAPHEFEGVGIGLATVQRVVQRHGGRVWAESAVGRGATFYFTLSKA